MTDYGTLEAALSANLSLQHRPVAVTFLANAPAGVGRFEGERPSGCSFWTIASSGRTFFTEGADHHNCPIGAYTHNIPMPAARARELEETLGLMESIGYIRMEEVPGIPRLAATPNVVVYAPLGETPVDPDVVLFWGPPGRVMLLQEAAIRAGVASQFSTLGRPTCMALPAALAHGAVASTACVGNRVYTEMDDGDLYVAVPGKDVARLAEAAEVIRNANAALLQYHEERRRTLSRN
jgi:uncharacterized protein (DUF169 family)